MTDSSQPTSLISFRFLFSVFYFIFLKPPYSFVGNGGAVAGFFYIHIGAKLVYMCRDGKSGWGVCTTGLLYI